MNEDVLINKDFIKRCPILHVDGSVSNKLEVNGRTEKIVGLGGYFLNTKSNIKFSKRIIGALYPDCHEHYAVLEGLLTAKKYNIKKLKVCTDSVETINLFCYSKKILEDRDHFFLSMFLPVSYWFDYIDFEYTTRTKEDLAHKLSREYLFKSQGSLQLDLMPESLVAEDILSEYEVIKLYVSKFYQSSM